MLTQTQTELIQLYNESDQDGKLFIFDMVLCAATYGEEFCKDLQATPQEPVALKAAVAKWKDKFTADAAAKNAT